MSIFSKAFKYGNIISFATSFARKAFSTSVKLLSPKTPKLTSQTTAEQVVNLSAQNNAAKLGEPQTILYGLNEKYYPTLSAQAWSEFIENEQVLHLRMRITVGLCEMRKLEVGDVAFSAFGGSTYQLCMPGQAMTLFHPNVFSNVKVENIELAAGALVSITSSRTFTFGGAGHTGRIDGGNGSFNGVRVGSPAVVTGTAASDGTYTITAYDTGGSEPNWIEVSHVFAGSTETASVRYGAYDLRKNDAVQSENVALEFDATLSEIRATPDDDNPNNLSKFLVGDLIAAIDDDAGANRNTSFTVLDVSGNGTKLIVSPPPANLSGVVSTVVLLRRYHGAYSACPAGDQINAMAFDFELPQGIGNIDTQKGGIADITLRLDPQWQAVDDSGTPLGAWTSFPEIVITASSRRAYRRSYKFDLPANVRAQGRVARATIDATGSDILDAINLVGIRGYIVNKPGEDAAIDQDSTTLNVTLRSNQSFGSGDDLKVNGSFQRLVQTWDADTMTWLPASATSLVPWCALDKLRGEHTMRGRQIPDDELDLPAFAALAATGEEFNGQISVASNLLDNVNTILGLARGQANFRWRDSRLSVLRDEYRAPVQMFCDLNSSTSGYRVPMRTANDATGVQVSYTQAGLSTEAVVGIGDTDDKPIKIDLRNGCNKRQQGWERAFFEWKAERYRNRPISIAGELEPLAIDNGDRVLLQTAEHGWGQAAHVVFATGRALLIWPPLDWTGTGHRVYLRDPEGRPGAAISCTRDDADYRLVLDADPDVEIVGDDTREERTLLIFAKDGSEPVIAIIDGVTWQQGEDSGQAATMACTIDDLRVYADPGPAPIDPMAPVLTPPNLAIAELDATDNGDGTVSAAWDANAAALLYEADWHYLGELAWTSISRGLGTSLTFTVPTSGEIEIRVRALGAGGAVGAYSVKPLTVVIGSAGPAALTVTIAPTEVTRYVTLGVGRTPACTASTTGGTPPYAVLWQRVSGSTAQNILSPTEITTQFGASGLDDGESRVTFYRPRVTDADGTVAYSVDQVRAEITNTVTGGIPP